MQYYKQSNQWVTETRGQYNKHDWACNIANSPTNGREKLEVNIINMTGHAILQGELNQYRTCFGFTPVPRENIPEVITIISIFNRKSWLAEFFKETEPNDDGPIVRTMRNSHQNETGIFNLIVLLTILISTSLKR